MFMPRTQTPRLGKRCRGGVGWWVWWGVQRKCLGENEDDGWCGICRKVCVSVFFSACVCVCVSVVV